MKILQIQAATLTNAEVVSHVLEVNAKHEDTKTEEYRQTKVVTKSDNTTYQQPGGRLRHLKGVVGDVIEHFSHPESPLAAQARSGVKGADGGKGNRKAITKGSSSGNSQYDTPVHELIYRLKPLGLMKAELMHIANHRPQHDPELDFCVEEADARLTPEQREEIFQVVRDVYGDELDEVEKIRKEAPKIGVEKGKKEKGKGKGG